MHAQAMLIGRQGGEKKAAERLVSIYQMIGGGGAGIAVALNLFGSGGGGSDVVLVPNSRLFCLGTFLLPGTLRRLTVAKPAAAAGTLLASPAAAVHLPSTQCARQVRRTALPYFPKF